MSKGRKPSKPKDTQAPKRGPGRVSTYSEEVAKRICDRIEQGETLASICRDDDMPAVRTVSRWQKDNPSFGADFVRARDIGHDAIAARLRETARGKGESTGDIMRDKLIIETDLRLLAKWDPRRYGDKLEIKQKGKARVEVSFKQRGTPTDER